MRRVVLLDDPPFFRRDLQARIEVRVPLEGAHIRRVKLAQPEEPIDRMDEFDGIFLQVVVEEDFQILS